MNVLLLADKPNWAYTSIAQALIKYNTNTNIRIKTLHIKTDLSKIRKTYSSYDRILVMGWQNYDAVSFLDPSRVFTGIHSHHSWDNKKTTPEKDIDPPKRLIDHLNRFAKVNAVSKRLFDLFRKNGLENVYYTPNGVDSNIFKPNIRDESMPFSVGYSGSKAHDWRKGVSKFIIPAAQKSKVKTSLAMLSTDDYVPLEKMPGFYKSIDCYVCASSSEGFSLSVLEAAACGKPIITTAVGGMSELITDGYNGFIVPRNVDAISEKISLLKDDKDLYRKMSVAIRNDIAEKWCWSKRVKSWIEFLSD